MFKTPLKRQKNLQRNEQTLLHLDLSPAKIGPRLSEESR
jgi:hypothetical protein